MLGQRIPSSGLANLILPPMHLCVFYWKDHVSANKCLDAYGELRQGHTCELFLLTPQQGFEQRDILPILQIGRLRLRAVSQVATISRAGRRQREDLNPRL